MVVIWIPQVSLPPLVEWRARFEERIDRDFNSSVADRRVDSLGRLRVALPLKNGTRWTSLAQVQIVANPFWVPAGQKGTQNVDASALFVKYSHEGINVTLGRQKLVVGSERLIGQLEWQNWGRSWDGARLQGKNWEMFAGAVSVSPNRTRDARIALAAIDTSAGKTFFIWKHDKAASGNLDIGTVVQSHAKKWGKWEVDAEGALQAGHSQGRRHEAWALHSGLTYAVSPRAKLYIEANAASGGKDASVVRTFDNLYPSNHKFYGSMDMQAWKNMNEVTVGFKYKLSNQADAHLHAHIFSLRDARDAWYGAGGGQNGTFIDPTGSRGRDVGSELDLDLSYALDSKTQLSGGLGAFSPGAFVRSFGTDDRQVWFYVQITRR